MREAIGISHHPDEGFDHLADRDPGKRLEIPGYVIWTDNGFGCLAVADERTGSMYDNYNHVSLAIFHSVAEHGILEAAEASEARRLGISSRRANGGVRLIATKFSTRPGCSSQRDRPGRCPPSALKGVGCCFGGRS